MADRGLVSRPASSSSPTENATTGMSVALRPWLLSPLPSIMASNPALATSAASPCDRLPDPRIGHSCAFKEIGLGSARHEASDGNTGVLQLVAEGKGKAVEERFRPVVNGLVSTRHKPGDRPCNQDTAAAVSPHLPADLLIRRCRLRLVMLVQPTYVGEILVQERLAKSPSRVCQQSRNLPTIHRGEELVDPFRGSEIGLYGFYAGP